MAKTTKTKTTKKKTKASCPTDDLIKSLCGDLTPMQAVGCQVRRSFPWILFSGLYAAIVIHYAGMRPDLSEALHSGVFLFELVLVGVTALFAAFSSISMTVPDMQGRKWLKPVSFTLMGVFFLWAFTQWIAGGMSLPHFHWGHCINQGAILGLIPIAMLLYMTKRGSTTTPVLMSIMNVTAVGALAYIALRLTCMVDDVGHIFFFHVLPFLVIGTLLGALARKIYNW